MLAAWLVTIRQIIAGLEEILRLQKQINEEFERMSDAADQLKALITEIGSDVTEIDGDIQEILDKLAALGGSPTPEELAELTEMLTALKARTRAAADKVPEPPTP